MIRRYQDSDFDEYAVVLKATDLFIEGYDTALNYRKQIEHDPSSIWVATENHRVVGGVIVLYQPWVSLFYHLCVLPRYQNQGRGNQLLAKMEAVLRERGTYEVGCYVKENEPELIAMYRRRGFNVEAPAIPMGRRL